MATPDSWMQYSTTSSYTAGNRSYHAVWKSKSILLGACVSPIICQWTSKWTATGLTTNQAASKCSVNEHAVLIAFHTWATADS